MVAVGAVGGREKMLDRAARGGASPLAATGMTLADAIAPIRRRLMMVTFVLVVTLARVGVLLAS